MSQQLPERANLAHLRKQAKELLKSFRAGDPAANERLRRPEGGVPRLHDVQRALAREYGFPSWRGLVEHIEARSRDAIQEFIDQTWRGEQWWQSGPAEPNPELAKISEAVALMSGAGKLLRSRLADPAWIGRKLPPKDVEPLLYVCYSGCLQNPEIKPRLLDLARKLLEAGANPNATYAYDDHQNAALSCLYGAIGGNGCVELAEMLLDAGATPDDGESLYHSMERDDPACMDLLLSRGVTIEGSNGLARLLDYEKPDWLARLLAAGAKPIHGELQHAIARGRSGQIVRMLIEAGADPLARDSRGLNPLEIAILNARKDLVDMLRELDDRPLSPEMQILQTCLLSNDTLRPEAVDLAPIHAWALELAASRNDVKGIERLLALGLDPNSVEPFNGAPALHSACFNGHLEATRALLDGGASLEARDRVYDGYPLGWLCVGSHFRHNPNGDFVGVARLLIERGHRFKSVEHPDAPPFGLRASKEVKDYLTSVGAILS